MKDTYKITNVNQTIDEKDVVNKEYCDNSLLSFSYKIVILSKKITEQRKVDFDKITTESLQLNKMQVNEELTNEFFKSANEVTNTVNFCDKFASDLRSSFADTICKYNYLNLEIDNNNFN